MAEGSAFDLFDKRAATFLAVLSGLVSVALIAGVAYHGLARPYPAYLEAEPLPSLRKSLNEDPTRDGLKKAYRAEDLRRRRAFFDSTSKVEAGGLLLVAVLVVFALSMRRLAQLTERPPVPAGRTSRRQIQRERRLAVGSVAAISSAAVLATFLGLLVARLAATEAARPGDEAVAAVDETDVPEALRWAQFRGPGGMGVAGEGDYPVSWDAARAENIVWKTKVPLAGSSSPVVWGKHIFLTGADRRQRKLFCFDRAGGILEWECTIRTRAALPADFKTPEDTGLAAPTPAADGRRVYVFFGTNELAAVDFSGRLSWARWLGLPDSAYGISTSPILHEHEGKTRLILQHDQTEESFLYAFDAATGEEVWKKKRDLPGSWSTPLVVDTGARQELITCGVPWVIAYDPGTGKELWRADVLDGDVAPTPVYAGGLVYAVTDHAQLAAVRTGGTGDVTKTHVAWTYDEELPDVASPVTDGRLYLHATSAGFISCLDAKTGKELWLHHFERRMFWSSPTLVGDRVYATDAKGVTRIFRLAREFALVGTGSLGERVYATPAFVEGRIYMRGKDHLFCIAKQAGRTDVLQRAAPAKGDSSGK